MSELSWPERFFTVFCLAILVPPLLFAVWGLLIFGQQVDDWSWTHVWIPRTIGAVVGVSPQNGLVGQLVNVTLGLPASTTMIVGGLLVEAAAAPALGRLSGWLRL